MEIFKEGLTDKVSEAKEVMGNIKELEQFRKKADKIHKKTMDKIYEEDKIARASFKLHDMAALIERLENTNSIMYTIEITEENHKDPNRYIEALKQVKVDSLIDKNYYGRIITRLQKCFETTIVGCPISAQEYKVLKKIATEAGNLPLSFK